jgi:hypothetical protein
MNSGAIRLRIFLNITVGFAVACCKIACVALGIYARFGQNIGVDFEGF